jgi:L-alanine-DL-glutamate epimerase-like enolase superfamily enzyme
MHITQIEATPVSIPIDPRRAIRGSRGYHNSSTFVIVQVQTDEGLVGLGEVSCTPVWTGEDFVMARRALEQYFGPALLGRDPREIQACTQAMRRTLAGSPFVLASLEMALWDLLGKSAEMPLHTLLGGAVRESVGTKFSVSGAAPDEAADIAEWAVTSGFRAMKVKVGFGDTLDDSRVGAVRAAIGPDITLGIDANCAWTPRQAIQNIQRLADRYGIAYAEQPVTDKGVQAMADVRAAVRIPIVADESVFTAQDAAELLRNHAADILSLYVGKGGGIGTAIRIGHVAEAFSASCTIGSNLEMGIATAAQIHLGLVIPAVAPDVVGCDILSPFLYEGTILTEDLPVVPGRAEAPTGPGLGVTIDPEQLKRFSVDSSVRIRA